MVRSRSGDISSKTPKKASACPRRGAAAAAAARAAAADAPQRARSRSVSFIDAAFVVAIISLISFFFYMERSRRDRIATGKLRRQMRDTILRAQQQEAYDYPHRAAARARANRVPRNNGTIRWLWDDAGYEDPWWTYHRELVDSCFWTHPAWAAYLRRLHMMRDGIAPKRYLMWSQRSSHGRSQGIGHSMQGLLIAFYLAMMSGRAFVINWTSPLDLEKVYQPLEVDWRLSQTPEVLTMPHRWAIELDVSQISAIAYSAEPSVVVESNVVANFSQQNLFVRQKLLGLDFENTAVLDLVNTEQQLSACAFHSLFALPANWTEKVEEWPVPLGPRIGVQLRFGDVVFGLHPSDRRKGMFDVSNMTRMAMTCAQQLALQAGFSDPCVIILESDSDNAKMDAANYDGLCKVWVSSHFSKHTSQLSSLFERHRGLAMWYAWSRLTAVELLLVTGSLFGATAGRVGLTAVDRRRVMDLMQLLPKTPEQPVLCRLSAG